MSLRVSPVGRNGPLRRRLTQARLAALARDTQPVGVAVPFAVERVLKMMKWPDVSKILDVADASAILYLRIGVIARNENFSTCLDSWTDEMLVVQILMGHRLVV